MTRFFGGMGGGGAGSRFGSGKDKDKKNASSLERALAGKKGPGDKKTSEMSAEERYQKLISQKMEKHKQQLMMQKKHSNHNLPGTKQMDGEMSKSTQAALEIMAARMAKREMKKKKGAEPIKITPTAIGGLYTGFIDAKGNVWNAQNKKVLTIDTKTGAIKTTGLFARKIGTYDPKSNFCFYKIQKQLEAYALKHGAGANNIWGQQSGAKPASDPNSIYGSSSWGSSGGDDGGNKGWW